MNYSSRKPMKNVQSLEKKRNERRGTFEASSERETNEWKRAFKREC